MQVSELTGRQMMIDYSGGKQKPLPGMEARPVLMARPKKEQGAGGKAVSIGGFNAGKLDGVLLNRSGATGVSLHASKTFKDKKPRRMLLVQAEPNIDVHMQMLGRIHRTGQVELPRYTQIAADIPAEARPLAVLMKKMASLNANTTASRKSVFMTEAVDFINEYGDTVVGEMLNEDRALNKRLGEPLKIDPTETKVVYTDTARRATGRLVLLPPAEQAEFLDRVVTAYKEKIDALDLLGENMLEAKSIDLQAKSIEVTQLKARTGEGTFLGPVLLDKVSAKAQGRAMAPDAVAKAVAETLNAPVMAGGPEVALTDLNLKGRAWAQAKANEMAELFRTWSQLAIAGVAEDKRAGTQTALDNNLHRWRMTLQTAYPGAAVKLEGLPSGDYNGIVTKVARGGKGKNPLALSLL
jgi:hypothetical protein